MFYGYETCVYSLKISWPPYTHLTLHICNNKKYEKVLVILSYDFPAVEGITCYYQTDFTPCHRNDGLCELPLPLVRLYLVIHCDKRFKLSENHESVGYSSIRCLVEITLLYAYVNTKYYAMITCCTMTLTNWCWWNCIYKHIKEYSLYRKEKYLSINGLTLAE